MPPPKIITSAERAARKAAKNTIGLGDAISSVATPIAAALHLPCIDPTTKQLRPESGCAKRKQVLNEATNKVRNVLRDVLGYEVPPDQAS